MGGVVGAQSAREYLMYSTDFLKPYTKQAVELLGETVGMSKYTDWDMAESKKTMGWELEDYQNDAQGVVTEMLHSAAFGDASPLGRSHICPKRNLAKLSKVEVLEYMQTQFVGDNIVVVGAGVEHQELVGLVESVFEGVPVRSTEKIIPESPYKGGELRLRADSPLTHMALGFSTQGGWSSNEYLPMCVLHMMLGGGSSFSAGGPGKGMYSKLYTDVLPHQWVNSCTAFNSMYNKEGILGIYGTCVPQMAGQLVSAMGAALKDVATNEPVERDVTRAKNALKSSILMNLEKREVLFEDLGRQVLTFGKRLEPEDLCKQIDGLTGKQIQQAAQALLSSKPTVAAFGDISALPSYEQIEGLFK